LRDVKPPEPPAAVPIMTEAPPTAKPEPRRLEPGESAHDLFISALTCFGAPIYTDAIGVELRDATSTIDRACAPLRGAAFGLGANPEDDDAYVDAIRRAVELRGEDLKKADRGELLELFDKGLHAVREARSPWGLGPWEELVQLGDRLASPLLRDEAKALATLLETDRRLRNDDRKQPAARELAILEERLIEQSGRLPPSDLRTALDGCVQRLRTML
jgi:hypothetical protein